MSVQELETAVTQLPSPELAQFAAWFEEYQADLWDKQITTPQFWQLDSALPCEVRLLADKKFELLKAEAGHSSLRLKKAVW